MNSVDLIRVRIVTHLFLWHRRSGMTTLTGAGIARFYGSFGPTDRWLSGDVLRFIVFIAALDMMQSRDLLQCGPAAHTAICGNTS